MLRFLLLILICLGSTLNAAVLFPVDGAKGVCVDTPLRMTFDSPPVLDKGNINVTNTADGSVVQSIDVTARTAVQSIGGVPHFNYYPIIVSGNDATIYLPNGSLAYNKTYHVTGMNGDWQFTTKASPPLAGRTSLTVAADGTGDFCTVQGALDFVPDNNAKRITIFVRKSIYTELIYFSKKHEVTINGEDRKQTVIEYANNAVFNPASDQGYHRGVFLASNCNDLVVSNLTIRNTTPRGGSQAEAIILNGNPSSKTIIANVDLYSFQDTLQINGQAYLSNCYIEGDVDFMWGKGPCFFEGCHCFGTRSKAYYAQIRNPATNHGYVYHRCIFDGPDGVTGMYLNRIAPSAYPNCEMVLLDCQLSSAVGPVGWLLNASAKGARAPTTAPDIHFWEYNSHDISGKPIDTSKRLNASRQLKLPDDADLIANYSQPSFVLGNHWEAQADPNLPLLTKDRQ